MAFAEVILKSIEIHNTDEDDAEWHFNAGADTASHSMQFNWDADGVSDGDVYNFNWFLPNGQPIPVSDVFRVNPGEQIFIHAGGFEEDDPGIPLFDDNDPIPGFGFTIDPAAVSAGDDFAVQGADKDFHYTLHWDINYFG
jgi:hypothetical protein